jgi:hypothetical protein
MVKSVRMAALRSNRVKVNVLSSENGTIAATLTAEAGRGAGSGATASR